MRTRSRATLTRFAILAIVAFVATTSLAGKALADDPLAGSAPANPGSLAHLNGSMRPTDIRAAAEKVAAWQFARIKHHDSIDWTFAPLYIAFVDTSAWLGHPAYVQYVRKAGEAFRWQLGERQFNADDQAIAQAWLALYAKDRDPSMLKTMRKRYDTQIKRPDNAAKPVWWWSDALFMAPPSWAALSHATGDPAYLGYMNRQWWVTSGHLYDTHVHLFSRDSTYLHRHERNGRKLFWCRGNGWVMAGLVRVLATMPADYPARPRYVQQLREMAAEMARIQGADGLWRPGLLDPSSYPLPDVSGSALITYAIAWGVNHDVLARSTYYPVVAKAWRGLVSKIYASGRLGDIQPIAAAPDHYPPGSSYVYGVGAFLLAARQINGIATTEPAR